MGCIDLVRCVLVLRSGLSVVVWYQVGLSLFNYQDDARSNKHKIRTGCIILSVACLALLYFSIFSINGNFFLNLICIMCFDFFFYNACLKHYSFEAEFSGKVS